ncbi:uncharacterized protein LOC143540922 [Bidens hawaiensis]|uniref:uncharacterized protein LOC143540922 n=1 Tax=Bidens hawaiensis TaxID=980011 RepID=UPI00404BA041
MLEQLGYLDEDVVAYHYKLPGEELDGLRLLGSDKDVIELIEKIQNTRVIEVYVEHFKTHPRKYLNIKGGNDEVREGIDEDLNIGLEDYQFSNDEGVIDNNVEESDVSEKGSDEGDEEDDFGSDKGSDETDGGSDKGSNDSEEDDSDYIVDEDYLDDAITVDMNYYRAAVEFNLSDEGEQDDEDEVLEEIDLDEFDSISGDETPLQQALRINRKKKWVQKMLVALFMLAKLL